MSCFLVSFSPIAPTQQEAQIVKNSVFTHLGLVTIEIKDSQKNFSTDIYFNTNASQGLDLGYDASLIGGVAPPFSVYSFLVEENDGTPMGIQSLGENELGNVTVPLGINSTETQQIEVSIKEITIPESVFVYLEDKLTGMYTLLNDENYTFFPDENMANGERFLVHFESELLDINMFKSNLPEITFNQNLKRIEVKGLVGEKQLIEILSLSGRKISFKMLNANNLSCSIDVSTLTTGIYIIVIKNFGYQRSQKVLIH
ncbi:T9SS type A sorting domain-containing protein [Winogradskyella ursingii]|uniref:T9SS type A sorting domain-containing protein n=1 Tax=Winogradskyella ursingii TaxID=2686079 RepID=UPI0015C96B41|nr:T9SS type A sorting domain-containing protein [Winogradskyella ursingii]